MKLSRFWFGFLLASSFFTIYLYFKDLDPVRGFETFGIEFIVGMLPLDVIIWRAWTVDRIREERMKKDNDTFQMVILNNKTKKGI